MRALVLAAFVLGGGAYANSPPNAVAPEGFDAFVKAEVLDAVAQPKAPTSVSDASWAQVPARTFRVTAQRSVHLH
ncbi:MAG: hypothetical protein JNM17_34850, partial [Archangium sp.]|nr:hypothetical protein [Archangium sp.]